MPLNFSQISKSRPTKRLIHPIELFQSLQVKDKAINDLWLAQGDALRLWHENRKSSDIAIILNTGAGKTLVGLLAAQSLVNETEGRVLYVCSSIQLVMQTAQKAEGYGLTVATYFERKFANQELYESRQVPCVTTYQALFNGRSRFNRADTVPDVVIFDDAHSAEHLLRDAFSLKISKNDFPQLFSQLANLLRHYHSQIGKDVEYVETVNSNNSHKSLFIPPFVIHENMGAVRQFLIEAPLSENPETMFAWEHIKNNIDLCCVFVSGTHILFTPPVVPTLTLSYFQKVVRRLYLSATLSAKDSFLRTFGKVPEPIIAPTTTAGECERLIFAPLNNPNCKEVEIETAKLASQNHKTLIIVPSERQAAKWNDYVGEQTSNNVTTQVEAFKAASAPAKLLLKGRYDGVDLPGDTCRVMVIDELPSGIGTLERFLWEKIGMNRVLRSTIASRIVQSFGRISRGMSDYGVVFLTGESLYYWLLIPSNKIILPKFLQQQLELGLNISRQVPDKQGFVDGVNQCLNRDPEWLTFYKDQMSELSAAVEPSTDEGALAIAQIESDFINAFWVRDFGKASQILSQNLSDSFNVSDNIGAWHSLWLGYSYELLGDTEPAFDFYTNAHKVQKNIPPPVNTLAINADIPAQVREVARYLLSRNSRVSNAGYRHFDRDLSALDGTGTVKQTEEAVRQLGVYLGLDSSRPDNEFGTGPDVLWVSPNTPAFCLELKTDKLPESTYTKYEIGQMHMHIQWCKDNLDSEVFFPTFIGHTQKAERNASPSPDVIIIELSEFKLIADRLRGALEDICNTASASDLEQIVQTVFQDRNLLWSTVYETMQKTLLVEMN